MCGIIGAVAIHDIEQSLLESLRRMEYRGYDSAGLCVHDGQHMQVCKRAGKLHALQQALADQPLHGCLGIAHTRWATHGVASEENAHPHCAPHVAIVHNGIIENHQALRERLSSKAAVFASQTDSEVIPWLLESLLSEDQALDLSLWQQAIAQLEGAYAILGISKDDADCLWFTRHGSPLLLGRGRMGLYAASDALALVGLVDEVMYLEEGDQGFARLGDIQLLNAQGDAIQRQWQPMPAATANADKGDYDHYMEKEMYEQPDVMACLAKAYTREAALHFPLAALLDTEPLPERIVMVACGTSYHAALTARYWLESQLNISVEVDVASEYRYRNPVINDRTWMITLSQSGETADTLEALRMFKRRKPSNIALSLCNVAHASIPRASDGVIELLAGAEIGVASTKAYTAQLAVLMLLSLKLVQRAGLLSEESLRKELYAFSLVPQQMQEILAQRQRIEALMPIFNDVRGALFLGRGPCYPLALEGALKLKEISYLHAEGYPAGEMKHGPIALIDDTLPVIVLAMKQYYLDKVLSNLQEVCARGARVILLTDTGVDQGGPDLAAHFKIPKGSHYTTPLLVALPLQLLAYHVARLKGCDVDQPRNLAKSVTVE